VGQILQDQIQLAYFTLHPCSLLSVVAGLPRNDPVTGQQGDKDAESHVEGLCVVPAKGRVPPWFSVCVFRYRHLQVILQGPRCLADPFEIDDHACLRRWLIQRECATGDVLRQ